MEMGKKLNTFYKKLNAVKKNNISKLTFEERREMYLEAKRAKLEKERREIEEAKEKLEGKS